MKLRITVAPLIALALLACSDDTSLGPGAGGGGASSASTSDGATSASAIATVVSASSGGGSGGEGAGGGGGSAPSCGDGQVDDGEACDDGNESRFDGCRPDCTLVPPIEAPPLEWTYLEVPGTRCMNGEVAGFGVSIDPDSDRLMIYLEGGGACFNDACDYSSFEIPFVPPGDGIFDRTDDQNPVADYSMIYVPYCTGDIHGGDATTELGGAPRVFEGYRNIGTYLEQWVPTFGSASTVLVTGISAGGFGAGLDFGQIADAFGPGPQMVLVDDSGPPLSSDVIPPCLQARFREVWGLDQTILAECGDDCPDPDDFATGFLAHLAQRYPEARVGMFSNTADLVIRGFMGFGWGNGQHDDCEGTPTLVPAEVYEGGLLELRRTYQDRAGTFFVGQLHPQYNYGRNHTVLRSASFQLTVIDGVSVAEWLDGVIEGEVDHIGP